MPFDMPPLAAGFPARGRWVIDQLMTDLDLTEVSAAGIVGNVGYESTGFTKLREVGQPEGEGGYGWAQWTAARRVTFLAWCQTQSLDWRSDEANYGYLVHELKTTQAHALAAVKACAVLEGPPGSVFVFGRIFEAPGGTTTTYLPGYQDRLLYAKRALAGATAPVPAPTPSGPPQATPAQLLTAFDQAVRALQSFLHSAGYYEGQPDGDWGPNSREALVEYRKDHP